MKITLYYFKIPFWRAEVTRLSLFIANIPFDDHRIEGGEYEEFKKTGKLPNGKIAPFKQLPVLEVDGKIFAQTGAIARYCGKLSGLYPKDDDYKSALIDQIIEAAQDINFLVTLSSRDKDPEKKKIARDILANRHLPKWFQYLENLNSQNDQSVYFVGKDLTIADLAIWRLLGWLTSGLLDGVATNILEPYTNLTILRNEIYSNPKVIKWMDQVYGKVI